MSWANPNAGGAAAGGAAGPSSSDDVSSPAAGGKKGLGFLNRLHSVLARIGGSNTSSPGGTGVARHPQASAPALARGGGGDYTSGGAHGGARGGLGVGGGAGGQLHQMLQPQQASNLNSHLGGDFIQ